MRVREIIGMDGEQSANSADVSDIIQKGVSDWQEDDVEGCDARVAGMCDKGRHFTSWSVVCPFRQGRSSAGCGQTNIGFG